MKNMFNFLNSRVRPFIDTPICAGDRRGGGEEKPLKRFSEGHRWLHPVETGCHLLFRCMMDLFSGFLPKAATVAALSIVLFPLFLRAGTNAMVTFNTNTYVITPTNIWAINAAAISNGLATIGFTSGSTNAVTNNQGGVTLNGVFNGTPDVRPWTNGDIKGTMVSPGTATLIFTNNGPITIHGVHISIGCPTGTTNLDGGIVTIVVDGVTNYATNGTFFGEWGQPAGFYTKYLCFDQYNTSTGLIYTATRGFEPPIPVYTNCAIYLTLPAAAGNYGVYSDSGARVGPGPSASGPRWHWAWAEKKWVSTTVGSQTVLSFSGAAAQVLAINLFIAVTNTTMGQTFNEPQVQLGLDGTNVYDANGIEDRANSGFYFMRGNTTWITTDDRIATDGTGFLEVGVPGAIYAGATEEFNRFTGANAIFATNSLTVSLNALGAATNAITQYMGIEYLHQ